MSPHHPNRAFGSLCATPNLVPTLKDIASMYDISPLLRYLLPRLIRCVVTTSGESVTPTRPVPPTLACRLRTDTALSFPRGWRVFGDCKLRNPSGVRRARSHALHRPGHHCGKVICHPCCGGHFMEKPRFRVVFGVCQMCLVRSLTQRFVITGSSSRSTLAMVLRVASPQMKSPASTSD